MPRDALETDSIEIAGREVPVALRVSSRARRFILRIDPRTGGVVVTLPPFGAAAEAWAFLEKHRGWLEKRLARRPARRAFVDGEHMPILDRPHRITHAPWARAGVWREHGLLYVSGAGEHLPRRVGDYLKAEARREIAPRAQEKAAAIERRVKRISVKDTRSRWGSCSAEGNLNFSWRLILAPETVLDYVVAHEVAHLVHMDHSERFWRTVAGLTAEPESARRWLKRNGESLWAWG